MTKMKMAGALVGVCSSVFLQSSNAQVVFSDTLQSAATAGNWTVNAAGLVNPTPFDYQANFGFDYSTVGVPQNPNLTGSSTALQLKINQTSGNQSGVSLSPTSLSLSGNFTMTFDMWVNYNSGGFTGGSTQVGSYGVTTAANQIQASGIGNGQLFGLVTDSGSSTYYRGYDGGASIGATPFVAGTQTYANSYPQGLFPSVNVPSTETDINPNQSGSTVAGTVGFRWLQVNVSYVDGVLSESINGNLIASYTPSSIGSDIFIGMYDINNSSANASNTGIADENFVLFNNIVVTVPEPSTCALAVLGGVGLLLARRRRK